MHLFENAERASCADCYILNSFDPWCGFERWGLFNAVRCADHDDDDDGVGVWNGDRVELW